MFSKIEAPNLQVTLNWVLEQTLRKRKPALSKALEYRLEAVAEPGILLDPNLPLADVETRDFKLIRDEGEARAFRASHSRHHYAPRRRIT